MADKTNRYRTNTGKVLTGADVDGLADEVAGDYGVDALKTRRRGRPSMRSAAAEVVPVRPDDPELNEAVESRAEREHNDDERDHA